MTGPFHSRIQVFGCGKSGERQGWEAEVNSMCACIFIQRPQPAWILVGKMPLNHHSCILQFHLHTWGYTQMKAHKLKKKPYKRNAIVHDGSKEHICMQPHWRIKVIHNKVNVKSTAYTKPALAHNAFFALSSMQRLQGFTISLPEDKNSLIRLFIMFSCHSVVEVGEVNSLKINYFSELCWSLSHFHIFNPCQKREMSSKPQCQLRL